MNKRYVGKQKEELAVAFLNRYGMTVLEKNYACKLGEVDVIGFHEGYLVFVEVKYRKNAEYGYPQEAVSKKKRRKIILVSGYYRMQKHYDDNMPIRYDVVSILADKICWDRNAFGYDDL